MTESELGDITGDAVIEKSVDEGVEADALFAQETEQTEMEQATREILEEGDPQKLTTAGRDTDDNQSMSRALVPYVDTDEEAREETRFWHNKQARTSYLKQIL